MAGAAGGAVQIQNAFDSFRNTIDELLSPNSQRYVIPDYQRPYQWMENHALALLTDARNSQLKGYGVHFFSSLLLRRTQSINPGTRLREDHYEVVDGQQRLTTWSLILCCLRLKHTNHQLTGHIERYLLSAEQQPQSKLLLRPTDQPFYEENFLRAWLPRPNMVFQDPDHDPPQDVIHSTTHWRMYQNALAIDNHIGQLSASLSQTAFNEYVEFLVSSCLFVKIVTTGELKFAHEVFSILNARGMQLSLLDTIKPFWAAKYINSERRKMDFAARWDHLVGCLPQSANFDQFFETFRLKEESSRRNHADPAARIIAAQVNLGKSTFDYFTEKVTEKSQISDQDLDDFADRFFESLDLYRQLVSPSGFVLNAATGPELEATQLLNKLLSFLNRLPHPGWIASLLYFLGQNPNRRMQVAFTFAVERMNFVLHVLYERTLTDAWFCKLCHLAQGNTLDECLKAMEVSDADLDKLTRTLFPTPALKNTPVPSEIIKYLLYRLEFEDARSGAPVRQFDPPSAAAWAEAAVEDILPENHLTDSSGKNVTTWNQKRAAPGSGDERPWFPVWNRRKWLRSLANKVLLIRAFTDPLMTRRSLDARINLPNTPGLLSKRELYQQYGAGALPFIFQRVMAGQFEEDCMSDRRTRFMDVLNDVMNEQRALGVLRQHFNV